jgi:hypothetical protein
VWSAGSGKRKRSRIPSWLHASAIATAKTSIRWPARRQAYDDVRNSGGSARAGLDYRIKAAGA